MKLKNIRYLLALVFTYAFDGYSQSCEKKLELARQYYGEGQLHLAYDLLDECLTKEQLTNQKMIDSYRLLANTSFLLDSISRGENCIKSILNRNLSFQADNDDVFKFRNRLSEIRKIPNMQFGIRIGTNLPSLKLDDTYDAIFDRENAFLVYGLSMDELLTDFNSEIGPNVGIVFVKNISSKLDVESGVGYQSTKFSHFDQFSNVRKETKIGDIQIPILLNYRLPVMLGQNTIGIQTGMNISILNSWQHSNESGERSVLDTKDVRTSLNRSWVVGAFTNLKIRNVIVRPGVQYSWGMTPRSETISDGENAAFILNEESFINYNGRLNFFNFSVDILKQRF